MIKPSTYLVALGMLFSTSCGVDASAPETSSETTTLENPYNFKEGEQIHWESSHEGDYIVIRAWLNTNWNTYSVFNTNFMGPLPTLISFEENEAYDIVGDIQEEGLKTKFDEESEGEIGYFKDLAIFKQKIKVNSGEEFVLKGNVNYMICNATKCLPPTDYNFELTIKP